MPRLRLVVDTNVVVSGALKPTSLPADAPFFAITFADLIYRAEIVDKYDETLNRPKFRLSQSIIRGILETSNPTPGFLSRAIRKATDFWNAPSCVTPIT